MRLGTLLDGARGFDCNQRITPAVARAAVARSYQFALRYVRRAAPHTYDLTPQEVYDIHTAGLGLMLVQHVAQAPWVPTAALGKQYGLIAAIEAASIVIRGGMLWCDLEGVAPGTPHGGVIAYLKEWYAAVAAAGFVPGLYVGDACGLTADELYYRLPFTHYWSAYNLNRDQYPSVRGVQMRQLIAHAGDRIPGCDTEFDVDIIHADARGGSPVLLLPDPRGAMTSKQSIQQKLTELQAPPTNTTDVAAWQAKIATAVAIIQQLLPLISFAWSIFGHGGAPAAAPTGGHGSPKQEFKEKAAEAGITLS